MFTFEVLLSMFETLPERVRDVLDHWDSFDPELQENYANDTEWFIELILSRSKQNPNSILCCQCVATKLTAMSDEIYDKWGSVQNQFLCGID